MLEKLFEERSIHKNVLTLQQSVNLQSMTIIDLGYLYSAISAKQNTRDKSIDQDDSLRLLYMENTTLIVLIEKSCDLTDVGTRLNGPLTDTAVLP